MMNLYSDSYKLFSSNIPSIGKFQQDWRSRYPTIWLLAYVVCSPQVDAFAYAKNDMTSVRSLCVIERIKVKTRWNGTVISDRY
jgi:hypothetical protein